MSQEIDDLLTDLIAGTNRVIEHCEKTIEAERGQLHPLHDLDKIADRRRFAQNILPILNASQLEREIRQRCERDADLAHAEEWEASRRRDPRRCGI